MSGEGRSGMACREAVELVSDYLERALSEAERRRLEAHLAECEGCEVYLAQMRQTIAGLRGLGARSLPADFDSLLAAFEGRGRP